VLALVLIAGQSLASTPDWKAFAGVLHQHPFVHVSVRTDDKSPTKDPFGSEIYVWPNGDYLSRSANGWTAWKQGRGIAVSRDRKVWVSLSTAPSGVLFPFPRPNPRIWSFVAKSLHAEDKQSPAPHYVGYTAVLRGIDDSTEYTAWFDTSSHLLTSMEMQSFGMVQDSSKHTYTIQYDFVGKPPAIDLQRPKGYRRLALPLARHAGAGAPLRDQVSAIALYWRRRRE